MILAATKGAFGLIRSTDETELIMHKNAGNRAVYGERSLEGLKWIMGY